MPDTPAAFVPPADPNKRTPKPAPPVPTLAESRDAVLAAKAAFPRTGATTATIPIRYALVLLAHLEAPSLETP